MKYVVKRKKTVKRRASTVRKEPELAIQIEIIEMLKKELKKNYSIRFMKQLVIHI